jgi:membrane-bound inhibitor of C-type lysozyme
MLNSKRPKQSRAEENMATRTLEAKAGPNPRSDAAQAINLARLKKNFSPREANCVKIAK